MSVVNYGNYGEGQGVKVNHCDGVVIDVAAVQCYFASWERGIPS